MPLELGWIGEKGLAVLGPLGANKVRAMWADRKKAWALDVLRAEHPIQPAAFSTFAADDPRIYRLGPGSNEAQVRLAVYVHNRAWTKIRLALIEWEIIIAGEAFKGSRTLFDFVNSGDIAKVELEKDATGDELARLRNAVSGQGKLIEVSLAWSCRLVVGEDTIFDIRPEGRVTVVCRIP